MNVNCTNCDNCEYCVYCANCKDCKECINCDDCLDCVQCAYTYSSDHCKNLYMCMYCYSLQGVPPINAPKVTTLTNAFEDFWSLVSVPDLKVASATSLYRTFFNNQPLSLLIILLHNRKISYLTDTTQLTGINHTAYTLANY